MSTEQENLTAVYERAKLAGRLGYVSLILAAVLALVVLVAGPVNQWAGLELFTLGLYPFVVAVLFSVCAIVYAMFLAKSVSEEQEKRILEKRKENLNSLLDISEDVRFTAKRSLANFQKYIPSALSLICFLLSGTAFFFFWKNSSLGAADVAALGKLLPKNPSTLAFLCALTAVFGFFGGVFMVGQSHVKEYRFLRPAGAWMILGAVVMALCTVSSLFLWYGKYGYQNLFEKLIFAVYVILAVEFLLNFVIEFYRPRTMDEVRPVYESRFLSMFTEPGGVVRNIADSLDYQFGFKVSKTWIYSFFQKALIPALLLWGFVFWLFTGIAEVAPGELGIRERFGAVSPNHEVLQPGVHLKLPWPCESIVRVPVGIVQTVVLGSELDLKKAKEASKVVLWTGQHYLKEDPFLVAQKKVSDKDQSYSVSILEVSIPVSYRAKADMPYEYAFGYKDLAKSVLAIGQAEATKYFASTDFMKDISYGREEVASSLKKRIQSSCDKQVLGVEIVSLNMHDAHPPVGKTQKEGEESEENVAAAFQKVVCAQEEAKVFVSEAEQYKMQTVADANVKFMTIVGKAEAYQYDVSRVASADAFRFESQLSSYRKNPGMFRMRTYLDFLENDCKELRKFVVSSRLKAQNYVLNLEEKPTLDLLDTDISELGK